MMLRETFFCLFIFWNYLSVQQVMSWHSGPPPPGEYAPGIYPPPNGYQYIGPLPPPIQPPTYSYYPPPPPSGGPAWIPPPPGGLPSSYNPIYPGFGVSPGWGASRPPPPWGNPPCNHRRN